MTTQVDLLSAWPLRRDGCAWTFRYPAPEDARGLHSNGFDVCTDRAMDCFHWEGLALTLETDAPAETLTAQLLLQEEDAGSIHHVTIPTPAMRVTLADAGRHEVFLRLRDFDHIGCDVYLLRFVSGVRLTLHGRVLAARLVRSRGFALQCGVRGQSAEVDETVCYEMDVVSASETAQAIRVWQRSSGWDGLIASIEPSAFVLLPGETQRVSVRMRMQMLINPGAHEKTTIVLDSETGVQREIVFYTMRALPHPYLYHDAKGWAEVKRRALLPQFADSWREIFQTADAWQVPQLNQERDYCFDTQQETNVVYTAYAWYLTRNPIYAERLRLFFARYADEKEGYPRKKKGCSQSYVQEGHFTQHLAIAYDLLCVWDGWPQAERDAVARCFRLYMDTLDIHITSGHISNWICSEDSGALFCALALQDFERAERFAFGLGGLYEQMRLGTFRDGWWHECSMSYNTWVSSMMLHGAWALLPFGVNLFHQRWPLPACKEVHGSWLGEERSVPFGMLNQRFGGGDRSTIGIKDLLDAALPFLDARGVLFGVCDSYERKLEGVHLASTYELAYQVYGDKRYVSVIRAMPRQDVVFGVSDLPEVSVSASLPSRKADNIGLCMLRSQKAGRKPTEQIQAVLRFGSHGFAHGHFDCCSLLSLMRYGRSFYNPECCWWGYPHFMYKFYVQNSMTKNMVVVDDKTQQAADSKCLLFEESDGLQTACVETTTRWSYPPFGGMIYDETPTFRDRAALNQCTFPRHADAPYGEMTEATEPITQRRLLCVADDFVLLFDYLRGETPHTFDCLYQMEGFRGLEGAETISHTPKMTEEFRSDAQFITDCSWYKAENGAVAHFETIYDAPGVCQTEALKNRTTILPFFERYDRSHYNEPGVLKLDVHTAWPQKTTQMVGMMAEYHEMIIPTRYRLEAQGADKATGDFGAWLGYAEEIDAPLDGAEEITLHIENPPRYTEQRYPFPSRQGLFLSQGYVECRDGRRVRLCDLPVQRENIDPGFGVGRDYENGRVLIGGVEDPHALPASLQNHDLPGSFRFDLRGLGAVRFHAVLGADNFPGDEDQRRRTYAIRTQGTEARFITVVEPFEGSSVIDHVEAVSASDVTVYMKNGEAARFQVTGLESGCPAVKMTRC